MSNRTETSMALLDIATTTLHGLNNERGPNQWEDVKDDRGAYGDTHDYEIVRAGSITVINPVCDAALHWCYYHLPEDCPRWGAVGFAIETNYVGAILEAMAEDGLLSEEEYVYNMNAEDRDRRQWED